MRKQSHWSIRLRMEAGHQFSFLRQGEPACFRLKFMNRDYSSICCAAKKLKPTGRRTEYRSELNQMENPIRASIDAKPRLIFSVMCCDNSILPQTKSAIATLSPASLAANVVVPVQRSTPRVKLVQETATDWDRLLVVDNDLGTPCFYSPLLLSSRNRWNIQDCTSEVFDRAVVIDGAKRLEAAFAFPPTGDIPVMIVCGLTPRAELSLRHRVQNGHATTLLEIRDRVDTTAPRLSVGEDWIEVKLCSDPFVVPTSLGYSPAILVRRPAAIHSEHLLIGAKSLARELETLRRKHGNLLGARIGIRKQGPKKTSPYLLQVISKPKGHLPCATVGA